MHSSKVHKPMRQPENTEPRYLVGMLLVVLSGLLANISPLAALLPYSAGAAVLFYLAKDLIFG